MSLSHLVNRISHDGMKQRRLACPVNAHNHMDFPLVHGEVNAVEEFFPAYGNVEILHAQQFTHLITS